MRGDERIDDECRDEINSSSDVQHKGGIKLGANSG